MYLSRTTTEEPHVDAALVYLNDVLSCGTCLRTVDWNLTFEHLNIIYPTHDDQAKRMLPPGYFYRLHSLRFAHRFIRVFSSKEIDEILNTKRPSPYRKLFHEKTTKAQNDIISFCSNPSIGYLAKAQLAFATLEMFEQLTDNIKYVIELTFGDPDALWKDSKIWKVDVDGFMSDCR